MPQTTTRDTTARRSFRALGITALGAVAALTLSSCGNSVPALEEVWPEVSESIQNAKSVAIEGNVTQGGEDMAVTSPARSMTPPIPGPCPWARPIWR